MNCQGSRARIPFSDNEDLALVSFLAKDSGELGKYGRCLKKCTFAVGRRVQDLADRIKTLPVRKSGKVEKKKGARFSGASSWLFETIRYNKIRLDKIT